MASTNNTQWHPHADDISLASWYGLVKAPSFLAASQYVTEYGADLRQKAEDRGLLEFRVSYPWYQGQREIVIPSTDDETSKLYRSLLMTSQTSQDMIQMPGLQIASMRLSLPVVRVLGEFLEHPERRSGLVRIADNRQLAMTESSSIMLRRSLSTEQAVQIKREDYFYLPDLEAFDTEWVQRLEANNPESFWDFRWRAVDSTGEPWRWFTNRYRLVVDGFDVVYHVSENLGFDDIKARVA